MNDRENTSASSVSTAPERVLTAPATYQLAYHGARSRGLRRGRGGDDGPVGARLARLWGVGWRKLATTA